MRLASHLRRSKYGVLSLRLVVPADLRPILSRREIKRSLKIRDTVAAQRYVLALTSRFGPHFEEFWQMIRRGYDPTKFDPKDSDTFSSLTESAQTYKTKINIFTGEVEIEADPNNPDDHRRAMEAVKESAAQVREIYQDPELLEKLLRKEEMRKAEADILAAIVDSSMRMNEAQVAKVPELTLEDAVAAYREALDGMKKDTIDDYMHAVDWFVRGVGKTTPVATVSKETVMKWRSEVVRHYTDVRHKKQARRVSRGHLKSDPVAGLPEVAAKSGSVDKIISRAHKFMMFCQKRKMFPHGEELPTAGITLLSHKARKELNFYEAFLPHELIPIFAAENLLHQSKPHEFWMPLLCLFTGARIGELSQIYHSDIYQDEDNYWVISIRDKEGFQRLKTNAACRTIPIHPMLLDLGFIDYVSDVKDAVPASDRLFPYLRYDGKNGFGDVPSESLARYLDRLGIHDEEKTAHSFRKTANQRLKKNLVEVSIRCQLVGHEKEGVNELVYATDISIGEMYEILRDKLVFSEVDFTPLKYMKGRFSQILISETEAAIRRKRKKAMGAEEHGAAIIQTLPPSNTPNQRMLNHLAAKAAREARANVKRGRPKKPATS